MWIRRCPISSAEVDGVGSSEHLTFSPGGGRVLSSYLLILILL